MAMLKNFYPQSRFLTPKLSHQLQASPSLQSRPASPLCQSFQEGATSSKSTKVTDGKRRSRIVWATKETQILLEIYGTKYAEIKSASTSQKRKIWEQISCEFVIACRRENISQIQQKSENNLENESLTWSTNIVKSGQEWTVLEKKALRKLWEPSNFFTLWISPWIEAWR